MQTFKLIADDKLEAIVAKIDLIDHAVSQLKNPVPPALKLMTIKEACRALNISLRTCQTLRDSGLISYHRVGSKILFTEADLLDFITDRRISKDSQ